MAIGFGNVSPGNNWAGVDEVSLDMGTGVPPPLSFFEDFNSYSGNQNNVQWQSGLEVAHSGNVPGWSKAGAGTIDAVDLANLGGESNPSDWAPMFFQDNVITLGSPILGSNTPGQLYEVDYDASAAVYHADGAFQATQAGDALLIEVLRGDNSVLASHTYSPGAWGGDMAFASDSFQYTGDGTGSVRLRIGPDGPFGSGRFEGAIGNLSVTEAASTVIPEPSMAAIWLVIGLAGLPGYRRRKRS